jgi:hypothetical protein
MSESASPLPLTIPKWWKKPFARDILNEALCQVPQQPLYHYTTQAGLLGIVDKKEIWATHTQYLNDRREFRHALEVFREELGALTREWDGERLKCFSGVSLTLLDDLSRMNVCVASFSEDSDSLPQWRAYGGGAGFSLGIPGDHLHALVETEQSFLARCVYDALEQRAIARALLEEVAEQILAGETSDFQPPGGNLQAYLFRFAPLFKHKSFTGEREWRIITRPLMCTLPRFDFRSGVSTITPYYRFPLHHDRHRFGLSEVIVGPTPHIEEAAAAVRSLLIRHDLKDVPVRNSEAPFRNW